MSRPTIEKYSAKNSPKSEEETKPHANIKSLSNGPVLIFLNAFVFGLGSNWRISKALVGKWKPKKANPETGEEVEDSDDVEGGDSAGLASEIAQRSMVIIGAWRYNIGVGDRSWKMFWRTKLAAICL
ncbi:hypothetical protein RHSIM_Rhsim02G0045400 [Rhododendron simsii]|uniref:Uncharacterized protein n=1 Tax=Rhododendron simsii TaxID=118357 RepID=A0A834HB51_RHOSS|nr:hypothetical protein RHSIM_Rhsim02G0045400 [Rhododendron simsii]